MKKRFLAAFLALIMVLGTSMPLSGMPRAMAATDAEPTTVAKVMAENYTALTDAEKAVLVLLKSDGITYQIPEASDNLVSVDTDNKKVTAETYTTNGLTWKPTGASIVVGETKMEDVALAEQEGVYTGTYEYGQNAFSVKVEYTLQTTVSAETQNDLLGAIADLKQGVANTDAVSAQSGNLYILEQAMPELVNFAQNGISTPLGEVHLEDSCKTAVNRLNGQMTANNGKLNLSVMVAEYDAGTKTAYTLTENGKAAKAMQSETGALVDDLNKINTSLTTMVENLTLFIQNGWVTAETANQLTTLAGVCSNLATALADVADDEWLAANDTSGVYGGISDYAALDTLVAALPETATAVTVSETLTVDTTTIQANLSMFDVTVTVALKVVEDKVDSAVLETYDSKTVTVTVAEGATTAEILTEIEKNGVETDAIAAWGSKYQAEHYEVSATTLPETLIEDIGYTITYAPKNYTVTYGYTTDAPTSVPYGYQLTLPVHSDTAQAYDYEVNGTAYAQGEVYTVVGSTNITRSAGKAYTSTDLYTVIADNFGANDITKDILKSGALKDNTVISVRKPDPADAASLLELKDGTLTAQNYDAAYEGLDWTPNTYGDNGNENSFSGNTASWTGESVKAQYILELTNVSTEKVAEILALAVTLKSEADSQKGTLDRLAAYYDTMGQLDKTKLGALNGVIDVTDFTPDDGTDTDAANLEMRAYFKGLVSGIIANNLDSNNHLKIYNILGEYNNEGLRYYYNNSDAVINEINTLSGYLTGLLADAEKEAALGIMVSAAGYPEYADKIKNLESIMTEVKEALKAPDAAIDLDSANLGKLLDALTTDGEAETKTAATPYLLSEVLTIADSSKVYVQVIISTPNGGATVTTDMMEQDTVLDQTVVDDLNAKVAAEVATLLGGNAKYYDVTASASIDGLLNTTLSEVTNITYTCAAKEYTVVIDGEANQTVTIEDLEINLPKHPVAGWTYKYTVDGVGEITTSTYTFTTEQLDRLFTGDSYTITRIEVNQDEEAVKTWKDGVHAASGSGLGVVVDDSDPVDTKITMTVNAGNPGVLTSDLQKVAMAMLSGYDYLYIGDELVASNDGTLVVSLQAFVDAILTTGLTSYDLIAGVAADKLEVATTMTLKKATVARSMSSTEIVADLTIIMNSIPDMVKSAVGMLAKADKYMDFVADDGKLNVTVDLPEKVYEVYLAALAITGNVDLSDINTVNTEVAYLFLVDYVNILLGDDVTSTTYVNTAQKLGYDISAELAAYEQYINQIIPMIGEVTADANGYAVTLTAEKAVLEKLLKDQPNTVKMMIKELNETDGKVTVDVAATVADFGQSTSYEAIVIDRSALSADGLTAKANVIDCTNDLAERLKTVTAAAAVMLQQNITGDLTFSGTTILDLNGKTVNGNITANGKLVIVDSSLGSNVCGGVTGEITTGADGSVIITGGKYTADVKTLGFLKDGYTTAAVGEPVVNELYTITEATEGEYTVTLNSDFATKPNQEMALALAADLAADLALNFYDAAAMSIDEYDLYSVSLTDLIDLYSGTGRADAAIEKVLGSVEFEGIRKFANDLLAKALAFGSIVDNDGEVAEYKVTTNPWKVDIQHKTPENYMDVGIVANPELKDEATITFVVDGDLADALFAELSDVATTATAEITDLDVTYANKTFDAVVGGTANAVLDLTGEKNSDYITVIAVALAKGGNDALLNAVKENKSIADQKAAFDAVSVKNVFDALKALSWTDDFTAMAAEEGLTVDGTLDTAYKKLAVAAGWALGQLDITGNSAKMGSLDEDGDGVYEYEKNGFTRDLTRTVQGYTFNVTGTASASLSVKLFGDTTSVPETYEVKIPTGYATAWDTSGQERYWFAEGEDVTIKINHDKISTLDASFEKLVVTLRLNSAPVEVTPEVTADGETIFTFKMPAGNVDVTVHTRANGYYPVYVSKCTSCHCEDCPCERGKCKCDRGCPSADFTDLHEGQWFHASSDYVICRGLMRGIGNNLFDPYGTTTRAMVVTTLYRLEGESKVTGKATDYYTDVMNDVWYSDALVWAAKKGLAEGYGNNLFGPNDVMTREQIATFFYRYAQYEKLNTKRTSELDAFADADKVSFWAVDGLEWAVGSTLFRGTVTAEGLVLDPRGETDRSQTAALLHRWCEEFAQ